MHDCVFVGQKSSESKILIENLSETVNGDFLRGIMYELQLIQLYIPNHPLSKKSLGIAHIELQSE